MNVVVFVPRDKACGPQKLGAPAEPVLVSVVRAVNVRS